MSTDPVREIGRVEDDHGRIIVAGVDYGKVTLRTLHTRTHGAVTLDGGRSEEFMQLFARACWEAGADSERYAPDGFAAPESGAT